MDRYAQPSFAQWPPEPKPVILPLSNPVPRARRPRPTFSPGHEGINTPPPQAKSVEALNTDVSLTYFYNNGDGNALISRSCSRSRRGRTHTFMSAP
jgi:hypothetical protein